MDTRKLVKSLNKIFHSLHEKGKIYTKVWLVEIDFGGLYRDDKYVLHAQVSHEIETYIEEVGFILELLFNEAYEEYKHILRVSIHYAHETVYTEDGLLVFEQEDVVLK